jgi:hypothetical protein
MMAEIETAVRPPSSEERWASVRRELRSMNQAQVVEWILDLSQWDCFFTCTFRQKRSPEEAEAIFRDWWKHNWYGVPTFYSVELHPGGHGAHLHGLMTLWPRGIKYLSLWETWFKPYGRCSFERPRDLENAAGYSSPITVYEVIKDGIWGTLGVTLNRRKAFRAMSKTVRQSSAREPLSCDMEVTVEDVIEGKLGLPAPVVEQADLQFSVASGGSVRQARCADSSQ